jgi:outer membrane protein OmpU
MNKLTKVGLTALATTLVSSASFAGEMSVSGSAALSYTGLSTNSAVNPWAQGNSIKFNGGGDLDNGMTVSVYYELDQGFNVYDDYNLKLGMGDMGTLSFSGSSSSGSGVDKLKDIVPTAYTPVYEATDATDSGLIDASGNQQAGQWGYDITTGDLTISASYNPEPGTDNKESETGLAVIYSGLMDGLELSAGYFDDGDEAENETMGIKYTMGNITAAYQMTKVDYAATGSTDQDATHIGVSIAVNDALSVSAGQQSIEFDGTAEDEKNSGIGASYTMGSISMYGGFNKLENKGGASSAADVEASIFNISFAF